MSFFNNSYFSRCTLRFPSTDLCITFSSLLNNNNSINRISPETISRHVSNDISQQRLSSSIPMDTTSSVSFQSVPNMTPQQEVILVAINQQNQSKLNHELNNNLQPLNINIPYSSSSSTTGSSFSAGSSIGQIKSEHESPPPTTNHSFLG